MMVKPEARFVALERRASTLEARLEELSIDTKAELQAITDVITELKEIAKTGFGESREFQGHLGTNVATKADLADLETRMNATMADLETRIAQIEATMATKEDLAGLEIRLRVDMATKEDLVGLEIRLRADMATKEDLAQLEACMKSEMAAMEKRIYITMDAQRESLFDGIRQLLQQKQ
jgi:hypothetical protein